MERIQGVECPRCGCEDTTTIKTATRWGSPTEQRRCNACARLFWTKAAAKDREDEKNLCVAFHVISCPACESQNTYITSTTRPLRRHQCRDCGVRFKSLES